ncbi:MAG: hypothetical protein IJC84_04405 [Clostridia bacterium]|nr:hypothetical protein [Clostridia bacterium]
MEQKMLSFNYEEFMEDRVTLDADFDNGSLGSVIKLGKNWYHFDVSPNTWYRFHFRVRGCKDQEIIFDFTCREIQQPGYSEGRGRWYWGNPERMKGMQLAYRYPYVSYDGKTWEKIDNMLKDPGPVGRFRFKYRFKEDEAYICHQIPYTYGDMLNWVNSLEGTPCVKSEIIGFTRNGLAEPALTLAADTPAKNLVVLIGREDADEPGGSFAIEGAVDYILHKRPDLLERYTFKVVPMVGIEGVVCGASHSAGYGYSGNNWAFDKSPEEIENVKQAMKRWTQDGYCLRMGVKMHGAQRPGFFKGVDDIIAYDLDVLECLRAGLRDYYGGQWEPFGTPLEAVIRPKGYFERYIMDEYKTNYVVGTHVVESDAGETSVDGGRALMHAIARFLDTLE